MKIVEVIKSVLEGRNSHTQKESAMAFAPINIALAKYWGKRDQNLNLPITDSLSLTLPEKGSFTQVQLIDTDKLILSLNGESISQHQDFYNQLQSFLNFFKDSSTLNFKVDIVMNVPIKAGLASSAAGYAALVKALNELFNWDLPVHQQSILARLGSGSACRSFWNGFVRWRAGKSYDGMDSYAEPLNQSWLDLRLGLLVTSKEEKAISSREGMNRALATSPYFPAWIEQNKKMIDPMLRSIQERDFKTFGELSEANALAMHATAITAWPSIQYANCETLLAMKKISDARRDGLEIYFTQDAGPNIKLLFLQKDFQEVFTLFPNLDFLVPFQAPDEAHKIMLVDQQDRALGLIEKLDAHQKALCHRAVSIFIFRKGKNGRQEVLLQQRSETKIHCGKLWTNTCCTHPMPGEDILAAGERRLTEEMGIQIRLIPRGKFHYIAKFQNGMTENEVDHVLVGNYSNQKIRINPEEVMNYAWMDISSLKKDVIQHPNKYTPWLSKALDIALKQEYTNDLR